MSKKAGVIGHAVPLFIPNINLLFDFCAFDISNIFRNTLCMEAGDCVYCVVGKAHGLSALFASHLFNARPSSKLPLENNSARTRRLHVIIWATGKF